jgi:hypothetical protein
MEKRLVVWTGSHLIGDMAARQFGWNRATTHAAIAVVAIMLNAAL